MVKFSDVQTNDLLHFQYKNVDRVLTVDQTEVDGDKRYISGYEHTDNNKFKKFLWGEMACLVKVTSNVDKESVSVMVNENQLYYTYKDCLVEYNLLVVNKPVQAKLFINKDNRLVDKNGYVICILSEKCVEDLL